MRFFFFSGYNLEKYEFFFKNRRIWPDWGNTTRSDLVGLGSIGLTHLCKLHNKCTLKPVKRASIARFNGFQRRLAVF